MSSRIPAVHLNPRLSFPVQEEPRRVLLVDDEPDAVYLFARMLVNAGIRNQFDVADGGEAAVAYLTNCEAGREAWPAAIFLDIKMPDMNGFELLEWMKMRNLLHRTVVVMLTSSEEPEDVLRAAALGAHFYLPKDARPEVLHELLQAAMRRAELAPRLAPLVG